ncbi:MAG: zf-HC2 domain-containing protein [Gemmatimonadota bacterium]
MNQDPWTDRVSAYADDDMEAAERAALEAHLRTCAACRGVLADVRALREAATALENPPPSRDLWPGIAARIREDGARVLPFEPRRTRWTAPRLAAAALAIVALGSAGLWLTRAAGPGPAAPGTPGTQVVLTAALPAVGEQDYEVALERLERTLDARREGLDPATVRVIDQSMAIIDAALADAERALERDPGSAYLNRHYDATMRKKIDLMRRAADATRAVS